MVEIMRRPRIIRETARGLETMSLEDDFFQKREIFLSCIFIYFQSFTKSRRQLQKPPPEGQ